MHTCRLASKLCHSFEAIDGLNDLLPVLDCPFQREANLLRDIDDSLADLVSAVLFFCLLSCFLSLSILCKCMVYQTIVNCDQCTYVGTYLFCFPWRGMWIDLAAFQVCSSWANLCWLDESVTITMPPWCTCNWTKRWLIARVWDSYQVLWMIGTQESVQFHKRKCREKNSHILNCLEVYVVGASEETIVLVIPQASR